MAIYQLVQKHISVFIGSVATLYIPYLHSVLSLAKNFIFSDSLDTLNGLFFFFNLLGGQLLV